MEPQKISEMIAEDPDMVVDNTMVSMSIYEVMVPAWFKEWYESASESTQQTVRPKLVDPGKRRASVELIGRLLGIL